MCSGVTTANFCPEARLEVILVALWTSNYVVLESSCRTSPVILFPFSLVFLVMNEIMLPFYGKPFQQLVPKFDYPELAL